MTSINRKRPLRSLQGGNNIVNVQRGPLGLKGNRTMNAVFRCARPPSTTVTNNNTVTEDDATFTTPVWGNWDIESLIFHRNPMERDMPIVDGVRDILLTLTNMQQSLAPLGIQVQEYYNDPVGAKIQTRQEDITFFLSIYRQGSLGRYTYGMSMREIPDAFTPGDPLDISRYRFQIRQAALGNRILERLGSQSSLSIRDQIRALEGALENSEEDSSAEDGNEQHPINSEQEGLTSIRREFDRYQGVGVRLALVTTPVQRRASLQFPNQTADALRQVGVWVVDATAGVPRNETLFLLSDRNAFRLVRHQEIIPRLGPQGRISFCERLTRPPTGRYIFQVDAQQRFATIIEVATEAFDENTLVALMTSRFLKCFQILQDKQGRVYFVCHNASSARYWLDQTNVTLPPPRLRPEGYQVDTENIRTWFRDLVLAVDAALQAGFDLNLDASGARRYSQEVILGQMLFECLTGVSLPLPSDQARYPFFKQFWFTREQLDHLEVPDRVMEIMQDRCLDCIGSNGPLGNLLELVRAVHTIPPVARDLLIQLLNQRLSVEEILRHQFLS